VCSSYLAPVGCSTRRSGRSWSASPSCNRKRTSCPFVLSCDDRKTSWNTGVNYLTSSTPLWYAIPDLVASTLLTAKPPKVLTAIRLTAHAQLPGLRSWTMPGGRILDPRVEGPWPAVIEHRHRIRGDHSLSDDERRRIERLLKTIANASGYGIYAEYNRQDLLSKAKPDVTVYSYPDLPFAARVAGPEDPDTYSCPAAGGGHHRWGAAHASRRTPSPLVARTGSSARYADTAAACRASAAAVRC
jgi:hypothetical protein